jgi:signal transduction histidine kinase
MQFFFAGLIPFLDSSQGNALYSLLVLIILTGLLLSLQRHGGINSNARLGLAALIGLRLIPLLVFAQSWLSGSDSLEVLAPLERGIHLISIVIFGWIWLGARRDVLFSILFVGAVFYGAVFVFLGRAPSPFNYSFLDYLWGLANLLLLAICTIRLRSNGNPSGRIQLGVLTLGQVLHMFLAEPFGSMPLLVEGVTLGSLPLLFRLRRSERMDTQPSTATQEGNAADEIEVPDFLDFRDLEEHSEQIDKSSATQLLEEALAQDITVRFSADICLLTALNEAQNQYETKQGYNSILSSAMSMPVLQAREMPRLTSALERGRPLRLAADHRVSELTALSEGLSLPNAGHLLAVPFTHPGDLRRWAILLINLDREWSLEDEVALELMATDLSERLSGIHAAKAGTRPETGRSKTVDESLKEAEILRAENKKLREELRRLSEFIQSLQTASPSEGSLGSMVETLRKENQDLKEALDSLMQGRLEPDLAKEELRLALEELAAHQARLDVAQNALVDAKIHEVASNISVEQVELIASIAQELRQPLTSIWGYTDLLLGESVGILGALQQKFLERVRNSTDRMNTLIEDLIRIVELEHTVNNLYGKPVDLNQLIEEGVRQTQSQIKDKEVDLRTDIAIALPQLNTDRDAVQQILSHLLQNAVDATPPHGSILVSAFREVQPELGDYVILRIKDSGGGIPEEHIARVFSRIYRSTNPVIEGVGDTGVGLSIAEVLTRALGGRIWVESDPGVGSAFNVLLPVDSGEGQGND